jgi:outer membrane lipoprotein-sorting protein
MKFDLRVQRVTFLASALWALCLFCSVASAQTAQQRLSNLRPFSADQTHTMRNKTTNSKVYFTQNAMRLENVDAKGNQSIQIMRFDQKVIWSLVPAQKMYLELPWASMGEFATWADQQNVQRESLGAEQIGEYHCDKFRIHVTLDGKVYTSLEWDAKELDGLPVKTQDEKGTWSNEYRNVQLGPQDPSLFEIPAGYQKLNMGGLGALARPHS